jgi:uncharacterized protein YegJ (DUF2314 family)
MQQARIFSGRNLRIYTIISPANAVRGETSMHAIFLYIGAAILMVTGAHAANDSVLEKSKRDDIARVAPGDPDMEVAFTKAQATLKEFLVLVRNPRPSITNYAVKIGVPDRDEREYFWISRFTQQDGRLIGIIDNTPRLVRNVREGEMISFKETDVVDWLYRENGRMFGNYTACALLKKESSERAEAFKKKYGLNCDP